MIKLHPEILKKDGKEQFVVLPWEEFQQLKELLEDVQDLIELRRSKALDDGSKGVSLDEMIARFGVK